MITYLLTTLAASLAINLVLFLIAFRFKTDKLTDASYALSFIVLAVFGYVQAPTHSLFPDLIAAMVCLWAFRLGGFLMIRIWNKGKDARFDGMREDFYKFGKFWLAQAVAVWIVMIPALLALRHPDVGSGTLPLLGLLIWSLGLVLEATADWQKYRFSQNPKNKTSWIAQGVWKYSRHPNYFGEISVWVGMYIFVFGALTGGERIVSLLSPGFIAGLLLFVSGIPILERSADERWGSDPAYQNYKRRTSILIPLPLKRQ